MRNPLPYKLTKTVLQSFAIASLLVNCSANQVHVDVLLSANETINPLIDISANMKTGVSRGVFFILDELDNVPSSVDDTKSGGQSITTPSNASTGLDPLVDDFSIPTSSLNQNSFYRIKMVAKDANGAIIYTGTGDCPIKVSLADQNQVKICFGANPPLCAGLTNFKSCPGL